MKMIIKHNQIRQERMSTNDEEYRDMDIFALCLTKLKNRHRQENS